MRLRRLAVLALALVLLTGCAELKMGASPTRTPVVGRSVEVRAWTVGASQPDDIAIKEGDTTLKLCPITRECIVTVHADAPVTRLFTALVIRAGTVQSSTSMDVMWIPVPEFEVTFEASRTAAPVGSVVLMSATSTNDVGPSDYRIVIQEDWTIVNSCASGTTCAFRARQDEPGRHTYYATVQDDEGRAAAAADPIDVVWVTTTTTTTTTTTVPTDPGGGGHVPPP